VRREVRSAIFLSTPEPRSRASDGLLAKRPARPALARRVHSRSSYPEYLRISEILRLETVGGALLLVATTVALVWANSPAAAGYFALRDLEIGYEPWHLRLSLGHWASHGDGDGVPDLFERTP
jgi:hypothetical protein